MRRRCASALAGLLAVLLVGCSEDTDRDPLEAALPAVAPPSTVVPDGAVSEVGGAVTAVSTGPGGRILVAADGPPTLMEFDPATGAVGRTVPLAGPAESVTESADGVLVSIPAVNTLVRLTPDLQPAEQVSPIGARDAGQADGLVVVARSDEVVGLAPGGLEPDWTRNGFEDAARLVATPDAVWVLDRAHSSLTELDPGDGDRGTRIRAGRGAVDVVADRIGRLVVVDTRAGELLIFGRDPILLLQRFPVPGAPYGLAYDVQRNLAWVTLTGRDELVAFELAGGEPVEKYRFRSVHQPNSVTVVAQTGQIVVGSASGAGVQVVDPGR